MDKYISLLHDEDCPDLTGRTFGDYQFIQRLGGGAMADVYLALQRSLNRKIAVKILKPNLALDQTYVRRFIREAQAIASLEHPHIVHVYEVGTLPQSVWLKKPLLQKLFLFSSSSKALLKNKLPLHYIAQEYVSGMNLLQYLRRFGCLSFRQCCLMMEQVCQALDKAAQKGIVHRDVKPENILLDETGVVKVADFGLALCSQEQSPQALSLTQVGVTLGTPLYMSPEQSQGRTLNFQSDVYSLGVTAYQMLTGQTPFVGETPLAVALQHLHNEVPPIQNRCPNIPPPLAFLIHRLLAKKPSERCASLKTLSLELRQIRLRLENARDHNALLDNLESSRQTSEPPFAEDGITATTVFSASESERSPHSNNQIQASNVGSNMSTRISALPSDENSLNNPNNLSDSNNPNDPNNNVKGLDELKLAGSGYGSLFYPAFDVPDGFALGKIAQGNAARKNSADKNVVLENRSAGDISDQAIQWVRTTRNFQTSVAKTQQMRQKEKATRHLRFSHFFWAVFGCLLAMLLGGAVTYWQNRAVSRIEPPPESNAVQKFDSVEEQWIFAAQVRTEDAWKSVIAYYPEEVYWKRKVQMQLARYYMNVNNIEAARYLFIELTELSGTQQNYIDFGKVGLAWCSAKEGNIEKATAALSEIRSNGKTFEKSTETLINLTMELIRIKNSGVGASGSNVPNISPPRNQTPQRENFPNPANFGEPNRNPPNIPDINQPNRNPPNIPDVNQPNRNPPNIPDINQSN